MKIRYLAHSSFYIVTDDGTRALIDPYESGGYDGSLRYGPITETADVVINTHRHADHAHLADLAGNPEMLDGLNLVNAGPHRVGNLSIRAVHTYHDAHKGRDRGENAAILLEADGLRLCHLGDLGHLLSPQQVTAIGAVDVLFIPVGGHYTIDAAEATQVVAALQPRLAIPMHFKTDSVDFPIAPVDNFLSGKRNVRRGGSEITVDTGTLPAEPEILHMQPSL